MNVSGTNLAPFFAWLLRATLQGSLLVCLILLIKLVLRNRLPARWHYLLWLVLLVRLSLPWAPQSRLSVYNLLQRPQWARPARTVRRDVPVVASESGQQGAPDASPMKSQPAGPEDGAREASGAGESPSPGPPAPVPAKPVSIQNGEARWHFASLRIVLPALWLIGAVVLAGYVLIRNVGLWRSIKRERPVTDQQILDALEDGKMQMGVQTIVGLVVTDRVKSPALFGFVRPRILLPEGLLEALSLDELQYVFLHELAHLKRRDIYLGWLVSLLQVIHWFNPLIWLAFRRMRADQEMACDALALSRMTAEEPPAYGRTIVNLLERFSQPHYVPSVAGILEERSNVERRMTMIAKFKKSSYQWSPLAAILIVVLACISIPDAISTQASQIRAKGSAPPITLRRIWSNFYPVTDGEPSPDGRYLSYTDWETGDLAVYEIATGTKRRLTNKGTWDDSDETAYSSRWSPDGKQIIYGWEMGPNSVELRVIGLDGSGSRSLYRTDEHHRWAEPCGWFPDGKHILTSLTAKDGTDKMVRISVEDSSFHVLKTVGKDCLHQARLSPDGQYIAYDFKPEDDENSLNLDIRLISTDGTAETSLIKHTSVDFLLGWAPSGKNVLFASDRTGTLGIWLVSVADGKPQGDPKLVKQIPGWFEPMGFARDGSYYYSTTRGSDDAYIATLGQETGKITSPLKKAIERNEGSNVAAAYSPDGKYLAYVCRLDFVSRNRGRHSLRIRSLETGKEREHFLNLSYIIRYAGLRWSPDGRSILVAGRNESDSFGNYKVDARTGDITNLGDYRSALWSHDGKSLLYLLTGRIMVHHVENGNEEVLYRFAPDEFIFNMALSPDGQWLALRCIRPTSLKILPAGGGEARELPEFEKVASSHKPIAWTADSKYVLFSGNEPGGGKHPLYRISVESGKAEKLGLQMNHFYGLSAHPNGRDILISGSESAPESEVWVVENFLPAASAPVAAPASEPTTVRRIGGDWGTFASLSPDGKYLCDVDWQTEALAVLELATGQVRQVTSKSPDDACYPLDSAISPDNREVAYLWWNPNTRHSSLHVIGLDGSGHRQLRRRGYPMPRAWSADGRKILAVVGERGVQKMVWISASDGSMQEIASFGSEGLGNPGKFDISPDGRFVAYDRPQTEGDSKRDLFLWDLQEKREIHLVRHPAKDKLLGWTPDGNHVLFASDRAGSWDAWLLQVADGKRQAFPQLVRPGIGGTGEVRPIGFTPSGSYYYAQEQILEDVFVAKLNLDTGEVLSEPVPVRQTGATACHDWSPDGRFLAYCERSPDESQVIHVRTLATGRERTLAENLPYIRWLRWSPDGRSILTDGARPGDSQGVIFKLDAQTGERSDLVRSETEVLVRPEMSPDTKTLYYDRNDPESRTVRLMARDLESGGEKEVVRIDPPARLTGSALSPDGRHLVLSIVPDRQGPGGPVLKTISTSGGQPKELLRFDGSEGLWAVGVTWMPDSRNVLFWKWFLGDKPGELWRVSAEGGEPRRLWVATDRNVGPGHLRVHPDGQRVAFQGRSTTRGIWAMENFLPADTAARESK